MATEQDASSLAAVLGVTTRSAHGSGAIARAPWRGGGTVEREADGRELAGGEEWKRLVDGATLTGTARGESCLLRSGESSPKNDLGRTHALKI